jgi:hypothetical protein
MPATKIMLIRHAEKPNGDVGLMPDGAQNPEARTALGWTRANALVGLFALANEASPRPPLARPKSLFASGSQRLRPKQTIAPLAAALDLLVTTLPKGQEAQLVAAVKVADGLALISWQHEAIPQIAALIRGRADGIPPAWPGRRFDLVWVFDLTGYGTWSFEGAATAAAGRLLEAETAASRRTARPSALAHMRPESGAESLRSEQSQGNFVRRNPRGPPWSRPPFALPRRIATSAAAR